MSNVTGKIVALGGGDGASEAEVEELRSAIEILEPTASASDVGKFLKAKTVEDGKVTEYEFDAPAIDPEDVADAVDDWLDEHPEATTTVQDGSITKAKLADSLASEINNIEAYAFNNAVVFGTNTKQYTSGNWSYVDKTYHLSAGSYKIFAFDLTLSSVGYASVLKSSGGSTSSLVARLPTVGEYSFTLADESDIIVRMQVSTGSAPSSGYYHIGYAIYDSDVFVTIDDLKTYLEAEIDAENYDYKQDCPDLFVTGGYVKTNGDLATDADYSHTDYLFITKGKDIELHQCQSGNQYMALIAFYDRNKTFISALSKVTESATDDYTVSASDIPSNAMYIRVSTQTSVRNRASNYSYVGYKFTSKVLLAMIQRNAEDISKIENKLSTFSAFTTSGTVEPNNVLTLPSIDVQKNSLFIAKIDGTISDVSMGVGYYADNTAKRMYNARWIQITPTQIKLYSYHNTSWEVEETYVNGTDYNFTLTTKTTILVDVTLDGTSYDYTLKISDEKGNSFTLPIQAWGDGMPFFSNDNSSGDLSVKLSFMPRDITKKIWAFGDSYYDFWIQHIYALGYGDWLRNSKSGLSPYTGFNELKNLLTLGYKPTYVFWCLGMNGATEESQEQGEYVINPTQKTYVDGVKTVCDNYGIIPVFVCVPSTPTVQRTGYRSYIMSLGVRYVDIYDAVGTSASGQWTEGLLANDNLHPSALGAKVIADRMMLDFPEIALCD